MEEQQRLAAVDPLLARRPLPSNHELFVDGNIARGFHAEQMMLEVGRPTGQNSAQQPARSHVEHESTAPRSGHDAEIDLLAGRGASP